LDIIIIPKALKKVKKKLCIKFIIFYLKTMGYMVFEGCKNTPIPHTLPTNDDKTYKV